MKAILEPEARFKLERLCDYKYPQEVGGRLLGELKTDYIIQDIFPIPNASQTPNNAYQPYSPYTYFLDLQQQILRKQEIGNFHSHPNGTVPSENDMKSCSGFNLWLIHHAQGEHTFVTSYNYQHLDIVSINEVQQRRNMGFRGTNFFLGDLEIDNFGRLIGEMRTLELLKLPEKTRIAYLKFLQLKNSCGDVDTKKLAESLNVTSQTARNWLKKASNLVRITRYGFTERR